MKKRPQRCGLLKCVIQEVDAIVNVVDREVKAGMGICGEIIKEDFYFQNIYQCIENKIKLIVLKL